MGKPSSSSYSNSMKKRKRSRSKYSPQGDGAKKRRKTRRTRSKKVPRHSDSFSYSEDDSRTSVSLSSTSSEGSYRSRRRSRSGPHKDTKLGKKRGCKYSSRGRDSPVRKRKGSKRTSEYEAKRKTYAKKRKDRMDPNVSSWSSGSLGCSTCQTTSSSYESEYERHHEKSGRRGNEKRKLEKVKSRSKRRRHRSRSSSSYSRQNGSSDDLGEERIAGQNTSKRPKSVIALVTRDSIEEEVDKDEHKEVFIYDYDDYPSCKSNDSNDGATKKELAYTSNVVSDMERQMEDERTEDAAVSQIRTIEIVETDKDGEYQDATGKLVCDESGMNDAVKGKDNGISWAAGGINSDDLESILRQRALENLRRFRGGLQMNKNTPVGQKDKSDNTVDSISGVKAKSDQIRSPKDNGAGVLEEDSVCSLHFDGNDGKITNEKSGHQGDTSAKDNVHPSDWVACACREKVSSTVGSVINRPRLVRLALNQALSNVATTHTKASTSGDLAHRNLVTGSGVGDMDTQTSHTVNLESGSSNSEKVNDASAQVAIACRDNSNSAVGSGIHKSRMVRPVLKQVLPNAATTYAEAPTSQDSAHTKLVTGRGLGGGDTKTDHTVTPQTRTGLGQGDTQIDHTVIPRSGSNIGDDTSVPASDSAHLSWPTSAPGDVSSSTSLDEGKEGSQLEQKTMTVMRGGEMVQVSYKVYIPKKTSALARRKLRR